jgi:hypothetical protein
MTDIDVLTFADESAKQSVFQTLKDYWKDRPITFHIINRRNRSPWYKATIKRQFQFGATLDDDDLSGALGGMDWMNPGRLVLLDDIVLAPLARIYGRNAVLSPHDCFSEMFKSHFRLQPPSVSKLKKYFQYLTARHYESKYYHHALLVHVITHRDRVWLQDINPSARYHVIPNADLLNPGFVNDGKWACDIMVWGDFRISSCLHGTREFLDIVRGDAYLSKVKLIVVGRVSKEEACKMLGDALFSSVTYYPNLEDESGRIRIAKVTVVPDIGGVGIKNRVVNILSTGLCLACLLPQMEGVELIADIGAINAVNMNMLIGAIGHSLRQETYTEIGALGRKMYQQEYGIDKIRQLWREMIERAMVVRKGLLPTA